MYVTIWQKSRQAVFSLDCAPLYDNVSHMNRAAYVIEKFGGVPSLARLLSKPIRTVQSWKDVGRIPTKHQQALLDAAAVNGIALSPSDFFEVRDVPSV